VPPLSDITDGSQSWLFTFLVGNYCVNGRPDRGSMRPGSARSLAPLALLRKSAATGLKTTLGAQNTSKKQQFFIFFQT
jgi:hypothetical protein